MNFCCNEALNFAGLIDIAASAQPRLSDYSLVPLSQRKFPAVPAMRSLRTIPGGYRADLEGPYNAHPETISPTSRSPAISST